MGQTITLKSKDKCILMVGSPGEEMNVHNQNPATSLTTFIHRDKFDIKEEQYVLPEPIYNPISETFVKRMSSETYDVKAGEYIQIIDPGGRQCSDFLAFDKRKLDNGIESIIDPTATRTFMGAAYPMPGLFSKFFDASHEPVIEVVRDTVGRHDLSLIHI